MSETEAMRWKKHLAQVRLDTQNDLEAFFNLAYCMAEQMHFPLQAEWLGQSVTVTAIDLTYSSHSHGLKVNVVEEREPLPMGELKFINPDARSEEWIAFYRYWHAEVS